jgi:hypothetical protein
MSLFFIQKYFKENCQELTNTSLSDFLNIISEKDSKEYLKRNYGWLILRANSEKTTKAEQDIF